jgi:hypothetical protein
MTDVDDSEWPAMVSSKSPPPPPAQPHWDGRHTHAWSNIHPAAVARPWKAGDGIGAHPALVGGHYDDLLRDDDEKKTPDLTRMQVAVPVVRTPGSVESDFIWNPSADGVYRSTDQQAYERKLAATVTPPLSDPKARYEQLVAYEQKDWQPLYPPDSDLTLLCRLIHAVNGLKGKSVSETDDLLSFEVRTVDLLRAKRLGMETVVDEKGNIPDPSEGNISLVLQLMCVNKEMVVIANRFSKLKAERELRTRPIARMNLLQLLRKDLGMTQFAHWVAVMWAIANVEMKESFTSSAGLRLLSEDKYQLLTWFAELH